MQINEKQLAQVNHQIQRLIAADNFYGKRLKEAGVDHVSTVEEFLQLPFSEKQDLREAYPLGLMTCKEDEVVRIHSSSGTTGMPVIIPYTARASPKRTASISRPVTASGQQESVSRTAARNLAQWQFLWDPATLTSSCR